MHYIEWNNIVANYLFKPSRKGQEVFLCISEDDLVKAVIIAADNLTASQSLRLLAPMSREEVLADFWRALKRGPMFWGTPLTDGQQSFFMGDDVSDLVIRSAPRNPAEYAKYTWHDWRKAQPIMGSPGARAIKYQDRKIRISAPLHMLYLLSFTLPLGAVGAEDSNKYYDAWNKFYLAPTRNLISSNAKLSSSALRGIGEGTWAEMWDEIGRWSKDDLAGERGTLVVRQFTNPNWKYVGIPLSQCLLPPVCLRRLDRQFYKWDFTAQAASRISSEALKACLLDIGAVLPSRTRDILAGTAYPEVRDAVIEQVRGRLRLYNGLVRVERTDTQISKSRSHSGEVLEAAIGELVLFAKIGFGKPTFYHRLQPNAEAEAKLDLVYRGVHYPCEVGAAWSARLDNVPIQASGVVLEDKLRRWKAVAHLQEVQFFAPASNMVGLPDYVAVDEPELGEMLVLCQPVHIEKLRPWLANCGNVSQDMPLVAGEATGYWYVKMQFERICAVPHGLPISIRTEKSIEAVGGLLVGRGDYLADAMPLFKVSSSISQAELWVSYPVDSSKQLLTPVIGKPGFWKLPLDLRLDEPFVVETNDSMVTSRQLRAWRALLPTMGKCPDVYRGLLLEDCPEPDKSTEFVNGLGIEVPESEKYKASQRFRIIYNHYFSGSSTRDTTPSSSKITPVAFSEADRMLYLLSARGKLERESFREAFGSLRPEAGNEWRFAMRWFGQLGHAAYRYERGRDILTVLPPTLSLLPGRGDGGSRFLLTGMRLPGMVAELAQLKSECVSVYSIRQHAANDHLLLPDAVILEGATSDIQNIAKELGFRFQSWMPTTAQWMLLGGGLSHYKASMIKADISTLPPPESPHRYFDPDLLAMKPVQIELGGVLPYCRDKGALVEYEMRRGQERFRLWLDGIPYMVEPAWGRYIILERHKRRALQVRGNKLLVPASAQLPGGIGLAASLLDGLVPDLQRIDGRLYHEYPATAQAMLKNELRELLSQEPVS
ncbi:hypothetical protein [Hymenobacter nivis]|nr:hypothetical protein [Hymenobacter nivis]